MRFQRETKMAADILIIDDEADIRELIAGILQDEGYETRLAHNSDAALTELSQRRPSLVVLDIWLQGSKLDGLELLLEFKQRHADLPVVIISGHGNVETAVSAIKRGAYDYIEKPFNADKLLLIIGRALETSRLKRENTELRGRSGLETEIVGSSVAAKRIAPSNSRVLISGPMGAGKELAARAIHDMSSRSNGPFVTLAAATLSPEHLEESLFGVENGTEQGPQVGALEEAHGGTLFLDEVADMPLETQAKVLRVLVDQTFQRVRGAKKIKVDVRIVSSTARNLQDRIDAQLFREDLYHRLAVVPVQVPGLAERRDDIPELVEHFCRVFCAASGQPLRRFSGDAVALLQSRNWPGNVRELRNNVERLLILASGEHGEEVSAAQVASQQSAAATTSFSVEHLLMLPLREARESFEKEYIASQLTRFGGNISKTAQHIGMERSALHRKLKSLGMVGREDDQTQAPDTPD
jgi:two-component system, NtrC family, nitrogen regulation response regulator NtrX